MLSKLKYIQLNHYYLRQVSLRFGLQLKKLKRYKLLGTDQIPSEPVPPPPRGEPLPSGHEVINFFRYKEENSMCHCCGISLLSTAHNILSHILLTIITPWL
jgi:hypothetical protein